MRDENMSGQDEITPPEPMQISGWMVVAVWILAALFLGSVLAIGLR
jgi:hypothetical protein